MVQGSFAASFDDSRTRWTTRFTGALCAVLRARFERRGCNQHEHQHEWSSCSQPSGGHHKGSTIM
jgi:hypothetical protein